MSSSLESASPQIVLQLQPLDHVGVDLLLEHLEAVLAGVLGPVHGRIGVPDEILGRVRLAGHRHPDARRQAQILTPHEERSLEVLEQSLGDLLHVGLGVGVAQEHGELVAAEPGSVVGQAQAGAQPIRDDGEDLVAEAVAQRVVDHLEVVQVQQQDRRAGGVRVVEDRLERVDEPGSVGETGQRIGDRLVLEILLEAAVLRDITGVEHDAVDGRLVTQVGERDDQRVVAARRGLHIELQVDPGERFADQREPFLDAVTMTGCDEIEHGGADQRVGPVAQDRGDRRGHEGEEPAAVDDGDHVGRVLDERTESSLAPGQPIVRSLAIRDVAGGHDEPVDLLVARVVSPDQLEPAQGAVGSSDPDLDRLEGRARPCRMQEPVHGDPMLALREEAQACADHDVLAAPQDRLDRRTHERDLFVGVQHHHDVGRVLDQSRVLDQRLEPLVGPLPVELILECEGAKGEDRLVEQSMERLDEVVGDGADRQEIQPQPSLVSELDRRFDLV